MFESVAERQTLSTLFEQIRSINSLHGKSCENATFRISQPRMAQPMFNSYQNDLDNSHFELRFRGIYLTLDLKRFFPHAPTEENDAAGLMMLTHYRRGMI